MADESRSRTTKDRSPNFPFISLGRALERAQQFYKHEKRGIAPFKVAAEHWRYSPTSSGALQTAAALKQYGLLVDESAGKDRKVRLTDLALRILLDTREDSAEREQLKREAALTPPVAAEVAAKYPDGLPSEGTLNHFLVLDRSFNPQTAVKVVRILKENEGLTRDIAAGNISERVETGGDSIPVDAVTQISPSRARVVDALVERQVRRQGIAATTIGKVTSRNCSLSVLAEGFVTQDDLAKLVKLVELMRDGYPKSEPAVKTETT